MRKHKANILGTAYDIIISNDETMPAAFKGKDHQLGWIDESTKTIYIQDGKMYDGDADTVDDYDYIIKQTIRHELTHAFLFESGLAHSSDWATNEEIVDWIARQFPKMAATFDALEVLKT